MSGRKNFPLRIPHKLYREIQKLASKELRSVNGQMEYLLTYAIRKITGPVRNEERLQDDGKDDQSSSDQSESSEDK